MTNIYDFTVEDLVSNTIDFNDFKGKAILIVNTASNCGFTPQFAELESLHQTYQKDGLVVISFPCNQFGKQEPNEGIAIGEFCQRNYGVSFLMTQKIEVNGDNAHPLFVWLKNEQGGLFNEADSTLKCNAPKARFYLKWGSKA